jgi:beta-galactosidase
VQFADWTPASAAPHDETVEVYSNCESVELFLNGQSLGAKSLNADASPRVWKVAYAPGVLRAVAKNHGTVAATTELRTAGAPARLVLSSTRTKLAPTFEEVARVTALVVDASGTVVPSASDRVSFVVTGPGAVVAVDSGDNASHEPFQATGRRAFHGRCVAFVRATAASGAITLTASAPGLAPGSIAFAALVPR